MAARSSASRFRMNRPARRQQRQQVRHRRERRQQPVQPDDAVPHELVVAPGRHRAARVDRVHEEKRGRRSIDHRDGDRVVQLDDGARRVRHQQRVQPSDLCQSSPPATRRAHGARRSRPESRRVRRDRASACPPPAQAPRRSALDSTATGPGPRAVSARRRASGGPRARVVQQHQREQRRGLSFAGHQRHEQSGEPIASAQSSRRTSASPAVAA